MKFNEKLIELRKKEGISQEELGYKLNVTRQTISKWELGQTSPEMDKLSEISNIFGVNVDELLNDTKEIKIEEQKNIEEKDSSKKFVLIILGVLLILAIIGALIYIPIVKFFANTFNSKKEIQKESVNLVSNIIETGISIQKEIQEEIQENKEEMDQTTTESTKKQYEEQQEKIEQITTEAKEQQESTKKQYEEQQEKIEQITTEAKEQQEAVKKQYEEISQQILQQMQ